MTGALVSMYGGKTFGEVDMEKLGLAELPCHERAGLVWVCLTPGLEFDADEWLGEFAYELETLDLGGWYLHEKRDIPMACPYRVVRFQS